MSIKLKMALWYGMLTAISTQVAVSTQTATTMQQASEIATNANKDCTINEIKLKNEKGINTYEIDIIK